MKIQKLVNRYLDAWNQQDLDGVLALMHEGAAYYDAFWKESCVGHDLVRYLHDAFEDYTYVYRQVGNIIETGSGVAFHYSAHEPNDKESDTAAFTGLEVFTIKDGKVLTVSNHYCDPRRESIMELAEIDAARHGQSRYTASGLASKRFVRIKYLLSTLMDQDKMYLNPTLTPSQLADQIGCSVEQLFQVANVERRADFCDYLDKLRARHARDMLREESDDKTDLSHVADLAGFSSIDTFLKAFEKLFGMTPEDFRRTRVH